MRGATSDATVTDFAGLRALTRQAFVSPAPPRVAIPSASPEQNERWTEQLRRHAGACGCEFGAIFLALAMAVSLLAVFVFGVRLGDSTLGAIAWWSAIAFGAALAGKLVGMMRSRRVLRRLEREVAAAEGRL